MKVFGAAISKQPHKNIREYSLFLCFNQKVTPPETISLNFGDEVIP